jgi:predicted transcriptional regulator of viral defense system
MSIKDAILAFAVEKAKANEHITTKECIEKYKTWYYANAKKYVGEALSRLVKSGKLVRVKQGVFALKINVSQSGAQGSLFN